MAGLWRRELQLHGQGWARVAGVDEAGRGPLAGPVVAAAVVLPARVRLPGLADSKQVTEKQRERLFDLIQQKAGGLGVGVVEVGVIDGINIHRATQQAMREALAQVQPAPDFILVDGWKLPGVGFLQEAIVDGDATCACIAAASIIAKVTRDRRMRELDARYPGYGFAHHKGYATPEHLAKLCSLGPCPEHRRSFAPVRNVAQPRLPLEGQGKR